MFPGVVDGLDADIVIQLDLADPIDFEFGIGWDGATFWVAPDHFQLLAESVLGGRLEVLILLGFVVWIF